MIIIPFKLPKWIAPDNYDIMDNSHPFTEHYLKRNYREFVRLADHPEMTEIVLHDSDAVVPYLFGNPSPLLTKLIMKKFDIKGLHYLTANTNPDLAEFIISHKHNFDDDCWNNISKNSNKGLTEFIKTSHQIDRHYLNMNTNPELIISNSYISTDFFANSNPKLTNRVNNFSQYITLFRCFYSIDIALLEINTNPELVHLILLFHSHCGESCLLYSNIGLTDYILNNPPTTDSNWNRLAINNNPLLEKFIFDNRDKISKKQYLSRNRHIFIKLNL